MQSGMISFLKGAIGVIPSAPYILFHPHEYFYFSFGEWLLSE